MMDGKLELFSSSSFSISVCLCICVIMTGKKTGGILGEINQVCFFVFFY